MRNLQKILALVLALVMSLSLMATAGAEFTDQADIDDAFAESVDVLNGLEVFQGYPTGDFQPKGEITRAEVAAIIYRIATGDVDDTQVGIYADYDKFSDVYASETYSGWAAGYINYCANAEYIKGRGDGKFYPQDKVTGYEALAMILRVVGYDKNGEFTGADWQVQTAAIANQQKVTKNVNAGLLGQPATREMVAELLCQAILIPTVNYTLAYGYQQSTNPQDTIAYQTFQMEKLTGVVTGNEYADLYATSPKPAGQTDLRVDGSEITLNVVSGLDDIGESCRVYVRPQTGTTRYDMVTENVYPTETNNVYEVGTAVSDLNATNTNPSSAIKDAGINSLVGAEHFRNYGEVTKNVSNWRIEYVIDLDYSEYRAAELQANNGGEFTVKVATTNFITTTVYDSTADTGWENGTNTLDRVNPGTRNVIYTKVINMGDKITATDIDLIKTIFTRADRDNDPKYVVGEVYVGTTSIANKEDISDDLSYEQFVNNYLKMDQIDVIGSNTLGNTVKIIDNDNDGVADYILQTVYTVAKVASVNGNTVKLDVESLNFDTTSENGVNCHNSLGPNGHGHDVDKVNEITSSNKVINDGEGELSVGDVVIYALIDGNVRAELAKTVTVQATSVNRTSNKSVVASDGNTYNESSVHEHSDGITHTVNNLYGGITYTFYLDKYDNLAAFTEGANGGFVLLTDGWFNNTVAGGEYTVRAYIDGSLQNVNVTTGGSLFVNNGANANLNNWNNLKNVFGNNSINNQDEATRNTGLHTIVGVLENGVLTPVDQVYTYSKQNVMIDMINNVIPRINNTTTSKGNIWNTNLITGNAYTAEGDKNVTVQALSTTQYYYVSRLNPNAVTGGDVIVRTYTGYNNAPTVKESEVEDVYVVATRSTNATGNPYYMAEVVVVELNSSYNQRNSERVFVTGANTAATGLPETNTGARVGNTTTGLYDYVEVIRANGERQTMTVDLIKSRFRTYNNASTNWYNSAGLYFMDESDTQPGVYVLEWINPAQYNDVIAGNYAVGYVNSNYNNGVEDWTDVTLLTNAVVGSGEPVNTNSLLAKRHTDSTRYWSLGYNSVNYAGASVVLNESNRADACQINPDGNKISGSAAWYNETRYGGNHLNEVLVSYSGSTINYVISFREFRTGTTHDVIAQELWRDVMPKTYTLSSTSQVQFWGQPVDLTEKTSSAAAPLVTVDYRKAVGTLLTTLDVSAYELYRQVGTTWERITDAATRSSNPNGDLFRLVIGNDTYYLHQRPADNSINMTSANGWVTEASRSLTTPTVSAPNSFSIKTYIQGFMLEDYRSTVTWDFYENVSHNNFTITPDVTKESATSNGGVLTVPATEEAKVPVGVDMDDIEGIMVTITAEDGTKGYYYYGTVSATGTWAINFKVGDGITASWFGGTINSSDNNNGGAGLNANKGVAFTIKATGKGTFKANGNPIGGTWSGMPNNETTLVYTPDADATLSFEEDNAIVNVTATTPATNARRTSDTTFTVEIPTGSQPDVTVTGGTATVTWTNDGTTWTGTASNIDGNIVIAVTSVTNSAAADKAADDAKADKEATGDADPRYADAYKRAGIIYGTPVHNGTNHTLNITVYAGQLGDFCNVFSTSGQYNSDFEKIQGGDSSTTIWTNPEGNALHADDLVWAGVSFNTPAAVDTTKAVKVSMSINGGAAREITLTPDSYDVGPDSNLRDYLNVGYAVAHGQNDWKAMKQTGTSTRTYTLQYLKADGTTLGSAHTWTVTITYVGGYDPDMGSTRYTTP